MTASVNHRFSERIVVRLNGDYGYDDQINPLRNAASAGTYTFWSVGCLLTYVLSPHTEVALSYRYAERSGNLDTPTFNRDVTGLSLTYRL